MTAESALEAYGYTERDGLFVKASGAASNIWKRVSDEGFACFSLAHSVASAPGVADPSGGKAWGVEDAAVPGWVQTPYRLAEKWENVSGLHPATHPECFDFIWPEAYIELIHEHGLAAIDGNHYVRQDDGSLLLAVE